MTQGSRLRTMFRFSAATAVIAVLSVAAGNGARADDPAKVLKAMSDYLASQKSLSAKFDSDVEVVTPELQKIQFTSSGEMKMNRPDKLRVRRTGGYADVELVYDGKTVSLYGNNAKSYVQADVAGGTDKMIDALHGHSSAGLPGADLLLSNSYDELMANVTQGSHIGQRVVDGVECEHLAFRGPDTDWQIWIETGAKPVPRKYVITSKTVTGAPQYTLRIRDWKTDANADADFTFNPPADATKVALDSTAMIEFDEIPPGTVAGAKK
ncbi:DUF2092 domain-containing protein [Bradyrhizobium sp. BWA-3-5]|uniref:DUF2092 domain-containing protein n=1 Tax=Bradyrhizobium sp. BWA-3-5 TaxID=3080013 RepID=UPI00293F760E|nr:DUF2092 domain-containing protein [Bradyrhizobium sp. BWA-3-5]WOH67931.1 DUF2092 domain-containing protein [Bradyrhizobium sp. BWA-3-5]